MTETTASVRIPIAGTVNFRDVGGLPVAGGGVLRRGVLYRSDALHGLDDAGREALQRRHVTCILDLRDDAEVEQMPNALGDLAARSIRLPLLAGSLDDSLAHLPTLTEIYRILIDGSAQAIVEAARAVARASTDAAVIVHCTAGKDRTGVVVAVILDAIGVERAAVLEDYAVTEVNLAGPWVERMLAFVRSAGYPLNDAMVQLLTRSPADAMAVTLDDLDRRFGGSAAYLLASGLQADDLAALRTALVGPTPAG